MEFVTDHLLSVPAPVAYSLIAVLVFAEAAIFVGFVLPGETAAVLGGVLAAAQRLSLVAVLALVVVSAVIGDSVGYEVGRKFGPRVVASRPLRRHEHRIGNAQTFLRERGGWAVFIGRFTAFLRAVVPGLAGMSDMPYRRFLAYNAAGALVWGGGAVLIGYFAGNSYAAAERTVGRASALFIVVLLVVGFIGWRRYRRRMAVTTDPDAPGGVHQV